MSVRLELFMGYRGVLPTIQFTHRKGIGTCDALLCVSHFAERIGEGQLGRGVNINFSSAFDRVSHEGILLEHNTVCIVGFLLSVLILLASVCGARVSACAGLINQLQRCQFDSRIASLENPDTAIIVGDWWTGVAGHHALYC